MTVTLVSGLQLRPGTAAEHRRLHDSAVRTARELGGLVRDELIPAVPGVQAETVALLTFVNRAALDHWLQSAERAEVLREMDELSLAARNLNVLSGFPGWFTSPGHVSPPRWKQASLVIAGLIPVSFLVTEARAFLLPGLGEWAVIVIHAVANVCALTWMVMPPLNRTFARWLSPNAQGAGAASPST